MDWLFDLVRRHFILLIGQVVGRVVLWVEDTRLRVVREGWLIVLLIFLVYLIQVHVLVASLIGSIAIRAWFQG